mgnify:CR=1 FL=1
MYYTNYLIQAENIEENINCSSDTENQSSENNEISQDIAKILFNLNNYNNKLISSIKRDYPSEFKYKENYSNKYYCINSKWMNYFLLIYNYKKIKTLISDFKINSEEELNIKIKDIGITLNSGYNDINKDSIKISNFEPEKKIIQKSICNVYKSGELARYFDDFTLVDKKLYDEMKQYNENTINSTSKIDEINGNIVEIYLVDDIFIYKISENILGIGIPEIPKETVFPVFKIQFFIIIDGNYCYFDEEKINSDSEINEILLKSKDLEKYLILDRNVKFEEQDYLKKIDMKFNQHKIGFIYNIDYFSIEKYWDRTEEKKIKRMQLKESFKKLEREKRKREEEILREIEKKQDQLFIQTLINKKIDLENIKIGGVKIDWRWYYNFFGQIKFKPTKRNSKIIIDSSKDPLKKENLRYKQDDNLLKDEKKENPNKESNISKSLVTTSETKVKGPIVSKSENPQEFPQKKDIKLKLIVNKEDNIASQNTKAKNEKSKNNNSNSTQNMFRSTKKPQTKLEMQKNQKNNNKEIKIINNNIQNRDNIQKKEDKKENIKNETMEKKKEKKQENNKKKQEKKQNSREKINNYNIFNVYSN